MFAVSLAAALAVAAPGDRPADYLKDVKPVLQARCFACHGSLQQKAKLRLDTAELARKGGTSGPAVVPGKPADSELIARVTSADADLRMPPDGPPLTAKQVADLRAWVAAGAAGPAGEKPEADPRDHWAFRPPTRPPVPAILDPQSSPLNPIDAFLEAERRSRGLTAAPEADRATLLRRVSIDLIGLPPTREELAAFLSDPSPDAYEKAVDRLLASPQYGERWGRHWLDVWRYSDWYGRRHVPDVMNSYPMIWRWRDWAVSSLNADKGYDRMVQEMLAGDELAPDDPGAVAATGFLVRNWFKWNYNQWMRDNVEHAGKAFLGLTFNCAHCHDHKYDPLKHADYFRLRAAFEPLELRHDRVPGEPDPGPFKKYVYGAAYGPISSGLVRVFDEKLDAPTHFYTGGDERNKVPGRDPIPPGVPAALGGKYELKPVELPLTAWYPGARPHVRAEELAKRQAAVKDAEAAVKDAARVVLLVADKAAFGPAWHADRVAQAKLAAARLDLTAVEARLAADAAKYLNGPGDPAALAKAASKAERVHKKAAAELAVREAEAKAAAAQLAAAADPKAKPAADQAAAAVKTAVAQLAAAEKAVAAESAEYSPFSPVYPKTSTGRRLALARWITAADNPLAARVAVNHIWNRHFGRPLATPVFDLGRNGKPPTHPALLDWLAVELRDSGWRMKPLHRLIVTSRSYQMRSDEPPPDDPRRAADPDNVLLWRFPGGRMEAEAVRDGMLHLAGELDATVGGPEVPLEQAAQSRRRSLYLTHHAEAKDRLLELFDAADPCDAYQRITTVVPQQALALSNGELAHFAGRKLAAKLAPAFPDDAAFARAAFEQVLGRPPAANELAVAVGFLEKQAAKYRATPPPASAAGPAPPSADPVRRAREGLCVALFSHNDFVAVR